MVTRQIKDFDIRQICESGQCFRMLPVSERIFSVTAFGQYLEVEQEGSSVAFSCMKRNLKLSGGNTLI